MQTFDARYKIQDQVDDATFHITTFQSSIKLFEPWKVQLKPLKSTIETFKSTIETLKKPLNIFKIWF